MMDNQALLELLALKKIESQCGGDLTTCTQSAQQADLNKLAQKWGAAMLARKKAEARLGL